MRSTKIAYLVLIMMWGVAGCAPSPREAKSVEGLATTVTLDLEMTVTQPVNGSPTATDLPVSPTVTPTPDAQTDPQVTTVPAALPATSTPGSTDLLPAQIWAATNTAMCSQFSWFFGAHPDGLCPMEPPTTSSATLQTFEHGRMIWVQTAVPYFNANYLVLTEIPHWLAGSMQLRWFADPLNPERDSSAEVGVPPAGFYAPTLGFGVIWRGDVPYNASDLRDRFGWATGPEVAYQTTSQCVLLQHPAQSDYLCYVLLPDNTVIQIGTDHYGNGAWSPGP